MDTRSIPPENETRELIERSFFRLNTCIPGQIVSFNSTNQTAVVRPAIKMRTYINGVEGFVDLPPILEVPLVFPVAITTGFALTLPVAANDPCLLVFSQRAIDNWHERGGIQPPEEGVGSRHHHLTDAFAILAPLPLPNVLGSWETSGIELRNTAKTSRVTVKDSVIEIVCGNSQIIVNADGTIEITSSVSVTITAPLTTIDGDVEVTGAANVVGALSSETSVEDPLGTMDAMRDIYDEHTHPGDSGGTTGVPNQQMGD